MKSPPIRLGRQNSSSTDSGIRGKLLSKNLNPLKRLRHILDSLPLDCVFDGEICVLDQDGKPQFNDLLFGRADPVYVFDLLFYGGKIFRPCH